jgi:hypothetical protein
MEWRGFRSGEQLFPDAQQERLWNVQPRHRGQLFPGASGSNRSAGDSGGGFEFIQEVLNDVTRTPFPKLMHGLVLLGEDAADLISASRRRSRD